jgi:hypothetical protein
MRITDFIRGEKEILTAESPNQARDWANKIRSNIAGSNDENLVSVSAEGFRVIISLKTTSNNRTSKQAIALK